jgi:hypothetical protein
MIALPHEPIDQDLVLIPPPPDRCPLCASAHPTYEPHNANSAYYQARFRQAHGREATWADAAAHCPHEVRRVWRITLQEHGLWTSPADDSLPIAEPT